jgi:uncharacterized membrane protein YgdD (TMEM256/DUF423 family)
MRRFAMLGALSAALAVGAGAFGAHALRESLESRLLEVFETAARYQMYHALGLLAVAWMVGQGGRAATAASASGWSFVAGTLLFSGSLYAMALSGMRALGAITPLGGVAFIAGWVLLAVAASRLKD